MNWKTIFKSFKNKDMQKRLLIVLGIIIVYRLLAHIPVPLAEPTQLKEVINSVISGTDFGGSARRLKPQNTSHFRHAA